jgi:hypothetical protein
MGVVSVSAHERNNSDKRATVRVWARVYAERFLAVNRNVVPRLILQVQVEGAASQTRASITFHRQTIGPRANDPPVTTWLQSRLLRWFLDGTAK